MSNELLDRAKEKKTCNADSLGWRLLTVPNILSLFRLVLLIPTVWFLLKERNVLAFAFFVFSSITDALDGMIARRFHQKSEWGKILDPLADKLTLNILAMILAVKGRIPLFLAVVVLSRDAAILAGSFFLLTSKTLVLPSNVPGKITGIFFFAMICAGLLNIRWLLLYLVPVLTVLVLITWVIYGYNFLLNINPKKRNSDTL